MEEQNILPFPYEIIDVTSEEQEQINKVYGSTINIYRLSRVGPKKYVVYETYKKDAAGIYNMPLRPTDVVVASYQRSGTTMTQELVWLIKNNLDYSTAATVPLKRRYSFLENFMFYDTNQLDAFMKSMDCNMDNNDLKEILTVCAEPLLDTAKVVYVARDPRDVAVSSYHCAKLYKIIRFPGGFKEFWNLFYKGLYIYCPIFEHVKEAWDKRHHPNMLFLFYEEFLEDWAGSIRRVADFLGRSLVPEEVQDLCKHLNIENFKKNKSVNHAELRQHGMLDNNELFIRKGKAGGWREYFDEEMTEQAEQWIKDNLQNTDLRYPHFKKHFF
ncbi:unnamed protein product [Arctia plantaginis]|uniref:Sulfotransferase domain-containing protein n=1 Tax=Arctia plantaginis TaxID=874455 RepID=A0A8S0ZLX6_ARCPL|nr:unnamed protein product [Arctia plantaginis]